MVDLNALHPGDMVKVVSEPTEGSYIVVGSMLDFLGTVLTIERVHDVGRYATILEDEGRFCWGASAFEYIDQREDSFEAPSMEDFLASISSLGYCAPEERRIL